MGRATWSKDDAEWLAVNPRGLPPLAYPYAVAHQHWRQPGPRDTGRPQTLPWDEPAFKAWHPEATRHERAVSWLWGTFGGSNPCPLRADQRRGG